MPLMGRTKTQAPPLMEKPETCPKCESTSIYLENAIDMLSSTGQFEQCWKCVICGWQGFLSPGFAYADRRTLPRPLGKLRKRGGAVE